MLGRLTIGTSLQAEEGADSPFSVDNGFAYASMQSTAFYSGAPVILYYNTGNETSMYFPNMIVTVTDPESVPEPASCLLVTLSFAACSSHAEEDNLEPPNYLEYPVRLRLSAIFPTAFRAEGKAVPGHWAFRHPPTQAQGLHLAELDAPAVFRTSTSLA